MGNQFKDRDDGGGNREFVAIDCGQAHGFFFVPPNAALN